jgi:uncharacterized repeat protein (TIGR03806 family)
MRTWGVTLALLFGCTACDRQPVQLRDAGADAQDDVVKPRCQPPVRGAWPIGLEPAFPNLTFTVPVDVVWAPHDATRAYVVEYVGTVRMVTPSATEAPIFLDLRPHLERFTGEVGLWDVAFHPAYPATPYVYAFLTGNGGSTDFRSVLLRYTTFDGGLTVEPSSEVTLLAIERVAGTFHGGGKIGFSADGLLWISTGDSNDISAPQNPLSLLGKMLRIDVDAGSPYAIPDSNPFAAGGGAPEVYAVGFRNPWRWSFDRATGEVWLGDVGEHTAEEIDRVVLGGNYGWNLCEGTTCAVGAPHEDFIDPVFEYGRDQGASVTGGYVYRGASIPELQGRYVFGDYVSGRIWTLLDDIPQILLDSGLAIAAFAEDPDGELLVTDISDGRVYRFVPSATPAPGVPASSLSATGCDDDPRLVGYDVNTELWSDGLDKQRHIALADGAQIQVHADGAWEVPNETVLVKTFSHRGIRVETRLLIKQDDGWSGWSYRWMANGTYAQRVDSGGTVQLDDRDWYFPSTAECARCHTAAAGHSLGLHQAQLDRGAQLGALEQLGVYDGTRASVMPLAALDDASATLSRRARSYLHVNCSMCHRPGGPGQGNLDLRFDTPLSETNTCDRVPAFGNVGIATDARIIAPGARDRSALLIRMSRRDEYQMPPLATFLVDTLAVSVIGDWIDSLSSCDAE